MQICGNFYIGMRKKHEQLCDLPEATAIDGCKKAEPGQPKTANTLPPIYGRTSALTSTPMANEGQPLTGFGNLIPHSIKEIGFVRRDLRGKSVVLEGRMTARNNEGFVWTARGVDEKGETLMWVRDLVLHWVST